MRKYLIIGVVVIAAVICLLFIIWRVFSSPSESGSDGSHNPNRLDKIDLNKLPSSDKVLVPTLSGDIETNNFLRGAPEITPQRVGIVVGTVGGIAYSTYDQTFYITISAVDQAEFDAERKVMENNFLNKLGISQDQACKLKVVIKILSNTDPSISDKSFPLSFCQSTIYEQQPF